MRIASSLTFALAFVVGLERGQGEEDFKKYDAEEAYVAVNPQVKHISNLALDLDAITKVLGHHPDQERLDKAYKLYSIGGYSNTAATLYLEKGLPWEVPYFTHLQGQASNGKHIRVAANADFGKGDTTIEVIYTDTKAACRVGEGLPDDLRSENGCLVTPGFLQVGNHMHPIAYAYNETDNYTDQTIKALSTEAYRSMRNEYHGDTFYGFFKPYVDFYGLGSEANFADEAVMAAAYGNDFVFHHGNSVWEFKNVQHKARAQYMELISSLIIIGQSVSRSMEEALTSCRGQCPLNNCKPESFISLDSAVAFYTGTMQAQDDDGNGNFFYAYANEMCAHFKTCGEHGNSVEGAAKINIDIFNLWNQMRDYLESESCGEFEKSKTQVINLLKVPIIQGFLFSAYKLNNPDSEFQHSKHEEAPMALALFPLLAECGMEDVFDLKLDFSPDHVFLIEKFNDISNKLPDYFECLSVCCSDIGGVWDPALGAYVENGEPCIDTSEQCLAKGVPATGSSSSSEGKKNTGAKVVMILIILIAVAVAFFLYRRRTQRVPQTRRSVGTMA